MKCCGISEPLLSFLRGKFQSGFVKEPVVSPAVSSRENQQPRSKLRAGRPWMLVPSGIVLWRVQRVAKNEAGVVQQSFEVLHLKGISQHLSRFPLHGKDRIIKIRTGMATFRSVSFHSYSSKPIVRESAVIILEKLGGYSPYLGETD